MTIIEKMIAAHTDSEWINPGDVVWMDVDIRTARDFGGPNVVKNLEREYPDDPIADLSRTFFTFDTVAPANNIPYARNQQKCRDFARKWDVKVFDVNSGIGTHTLIEQGINKKKPMTVIGFHHHLIPIPNSGREYNLIEDAGETLDIILRNNVPLVLMGHRHVPYGVKIHNTLLVNAGTFSCTRTRAHFGNTFNIIDIDDREVTVTVVDIEREQQKKMITFDPTNDRYVNRYYDFESCTN